MKNLRDGLTILLKYETDDDPCNVSMGDYEIYAGNDTTKDLSLKDKDKMIKLGWFYNENFDCWAYLI